MSIPWDQIERKPEVLHKVSGQDLLDLRASRADLELQIANKSRDLQSFRVSLTEATTTVSVLEDAVKNYENSINQYKDEQNKFLSELAAASRKNEDLTKKNEELEQIAKEKVDLDQELDRTKKVITDQDATLNRLKEDQKKLESQLDAGTKEKQILTRRLAELEEIAKAKVTLERTLADKDKALTEKGVTLQTAQRKISDLERIVQHTTEERDDLKAKVNAELDSDRRQITVIDGLQAKITDLETQVKTLTEELDKLKPKKPIDVTAGIAAARAMAEARAAQLDAKRKQSEKEIVKENE